MICEMCQRAAATVHITDLGGDRGPQSWDLCDACAPPVSRRQGASWLDVRAKLPLPRIWTCLGCQTIAENRRGRQVVRPVRGDGPWGYVHEGCEWPLGYELAPGFVRIERVRFGRPPAPMTPNPCDCELRDRAWDPNTGRCRTCRRAYYDPR